MPGIVASNQMGRTVGTSGIIQVASNHEIDKAAEDMAVEANSENKPEISSLGAHVLTAWERNKRAKLSVEQRMIRNIRQRGSEYEPELLAAVQLMGGSQAFSPITSRKCRAAEAWIMDVLMPVGDKAWSLEPTPIADISPEEREAIEQEVRDAAIKEALRQEKVTGQPLDIKVVHDLLVAGQERMAEEVKDAIDEEAKEAGEKMTQLIEDQHAEGGYEHELKSVIRDFVTLPGAIFKGPFLKNKKRRVRERINGKWTIRVKTEVVESYKRIHPLDIYPENDAADIQDGDLIERMRLSRKNLVDLRGLKGFQDSEIQKAVTAYAGGLRNWTTTDSQRSLVEDRQFTSLFDSTKIDCLSFWGYVPGRLLLEWGIDEKVITDIYDDYPVNVWVVGDFVIKAVINPNELGERNYFKASYEEIPGAFWGNGVPDLITDSQQQANSTGRAITNNSVMSSGPIGEYDSERAPGFNGRMKPWLMIPSTANEMKESPAVRFTTVPNVVSNLIQAHDLHNKSADEDSGIPAYAHGDTNVGGAGNTSSGLSMLMNASAKILRLAIFNFDDGILRPGIEADYHHNMMFSDDESVKDDLQVVARGSTALLIKEQMTVRQKEFAELTDNPDDRAIMGIEGRTHLLGELAQNMSLDKDKVVMKGEAGPMQMQMPQAVPQPGKSQTLDPAGNPVAGQGVVQ